MSWSSTISYTAFTGLKKQIIEKHFVFHNHYKYKWPSINFMIHKCAAFNDTWVCWKLFIRLFIILYNLQFICYLIYLLTFQVLDRNIYHTAIHHTLLLSLSTDPTLSMSPNQQLEDLESLSCQRDPAYARYSMIQSLIISRCALHWMNRRWLWSVVFIVHLIVFDSW